MRCALGSPALFVCLSIGVLTAAPSISSAQTKPAQTTAKPAKPKGPKFTGARNFLTLGAGLEVFTSAKATDTSSMFLETATVESKYRSNLGPRLDVGFGHWFTRHIAVGVGVSYYQASPTVDGTFTFPSPFVFDTPVTATTSASGKRRTANFQVDLHVSVLQNRHWQVVIAGGPMYTDARQTLITDRVNPVFVFPFTDITFTPASGESSGHGLGGHLGGSIARHLSPRFDLLGAVDYRHDHASLSGLGDVSANADSVSVTGGLRVKF